MRKLFFSLYIYIFCFKKLKDFFDIYNIFEFYLFFKFGEKKYFYKVNL